MLCIRTQPYGEKVGVLEDYPFSVFVRGGRRSFARFAVSKQIFLVAVPILSLDVPPMVFKIRNRHFRERAMQVLAAGMTSPMGHGVMETAALAPNRSVRRLAERQLVVTVTSDYVRRSLVTAT